MALRGRVVAAVVRESSGDGPVDADVVAGGAERLLRPSQPFPAHGAGRGVAAGFVLGLVFWAFLLFVLAIGSSVAYRPLDNRWAKTSLGWTADGAVAGYVANGMAQWSSASAITAYSGGSDIRVVVADLLPPIYYEGQTAQANLVQGGGQITFCEVRLDPAYFGALNDTGKQNTVTHELGHCLGLDHSDQPSVMMNPLFYGFGSDDRAGIASLYPPAAPPPPPAPAEPPPPPPTAPPPPVATAVVTPPPATPSATPRAATPPPSATKPTEVVTPIQSPEASGGPPPVAPGGPAAVSEPVSAEPGDVGGAFRALPGGAYFGPPENCGCDALYGSDGTVWLRWLAETAPFMNTLTWLQPGVTYVAR